MVLSFWEQWLWLYKFSDGDLQKAKDTWQWTYGSGEHKGESSWSDEWNI